MISFVVGVFLGDMIGVAAICPFRINRDGWLMKNLHRLSLRITVCFVVQNTEVI